MQIRAAVTRAPNTPMSLEALDLEDPRDNEVLVRVVATGVCHTDMVVRDGHLPTPFPVVLGHEGAGVVEAVGSAVTKVSVGDHVVMSFNSCGGCPSCQDSEPAYCHEFFPRNFFATRRRHQRPGQEWREDSRQLLRPVVVRELRALPRQERRQGAP